MLHTVLITILVHRDKSNIINKGRSRNFAKIAKIDMFLCAIVFFCDSNFLPGEGLRGSRNKFLKKIAIFEKKNVFLVFFQKFVFEPTSDSNCWVLQNHAQYCKLTSSFLFIRLLQNK